MFSPVMVGIVSTENYDFISSGTPQLPPVFKIQRPFMKKKQNGGIKVLSINYVRMSACVDCTELHSKEIITYKITDFGVINPLFYNYASFHNV